jgi:ubiquitin-conjugating enzyme E2 D/E
MKLEKPDRWLFNINGPEGTKFFGQKFNVMLYFPKDYPYSAPMVVFQDKIDHSLVDAQLQMSLPMFETWTPSNTASEVVTQLLVALMPI